MVFTFEFSMSVFSCSLYDAFEAVRIFLMWHTTESVNSRKWPKVNPQINSQVKLSIVDKALKLLLFVFQKL